MLDPDEAAKYEADQKAKHDATVLKKYDRNGNGVLDPEELAVKQKNDEKMQAMRDARAKKTAAKGAAAASTSGVEPAVASGEM